MSYGIFTKKRKCMICNKEFTISHPREKCCCVECKKERIRLKEKSRQLRYYTDPLFREKRQEIRKKAIARFINTEKYKKNKINYYKENREVILEKHKIYRQIRKYNTKIQGIEKKINEFKILQKHFYSLYDNTYRIENWQLKEKNLYTLKVNKNNKEFVIDLYTKIKGA
ncbi:MAG: hypothetical protein Ta2D_14000 [Rickettsiales bacterium]|nr:MAG: hypothetical protein Ta2D_14000 [Rickettsiales bacterium]